MSQAAEEEAVGTVMQKHPSSSCPLSKCSLSGALLQLPSSAGGPQSPAAPSSGGGGWHRHLHVPQPLRTSHTAKLLATAVPV